MPETSTDQRSSSRRLWDSVWGYDFFISYNQESSQKYASVLADRLRQEGHEVFIDHDEIPAGGDLSDTIRRAVERTQALIVIGTQEALGGEKPWVAREVLLFKRMNRQCFPILFPNSFKRPAPDADRDSARRFLQDNDRFQIRDSLENLQAGSPDETLVITKLNSSLKVVRRKKLRQLITLTVILSLTAFSIIAAISEGKARKAEGVARVAESDARIAEGVAKDEKNNAVREFHTSEKSRAEMFIQNGYRAIHSDNDVAVGVLWYATTVETKGPLAEPLRDSARSLVAGWSRSLPKHSLVHDAEVVAVSLSPDGQTLATASWDKTARLWDANTGQAIGEPLKHAGRVVDVSFSPDSRTLATASSDRTARLWDATTGQLRGKLKPDGMVVAVSFSPDGQTVVTASSENRYDTATLWDAKTFRRRGMPLRHHSGIRAVSFSPDGRKLATASGRSTERLWDVDTRRPLGEPPMNSIPVVAVSFSPDSSTFATASSDNKAQLWDADTGQSVSKPLKHDDHVVAVAFSSDGQTLATASWDATARLWDAKTGQSVSKPLKHDDAVYAVSFSPDGQTLRHDDAVAAVSFSPNGRMLATASWDNIARLWDVNPIQPRGEPIKHGSTVLAVSFSPDERTLATATRLVPVRKLGSSRFSQGLSLRTDAEECQIQACTGGRRALVTDFEGHTAPRT